jgi:hypothetical protein
MIDSLHHAGHRWLKVLFVLALAGSSTLFFIGSAVPQPPALLVVIVGAVLGIAVEWSYFTVSCDLTEAITEGNKAGIAISGLYTIAGGAASWFLFTNAALVVGWAPHEEIIGLDRTTWAKVMSAFIVIIIFVLSARRKPVKNQTDLQAIGRMVTMLLPNASPQEQMKLLATIAGAASGATQPPVTISAPVPAKELPEARDHITAEFRAINDEDLKAESRGASNGHATF